MMKALADKYGKDGLLIVAPAPEVEAAVKQYKTAKGIEFPMLAGADSTIEAYKISGYPFLVLVGKDRKILWRGNFRNEELEPAIVAALKAPAPDAGKADAKADAKPAETKVFVLKDGTKVIASKVIESPDQYTIKDEFGKFRTIDKSEVKEVKTE
jgi:rRNA maturation protein Nop10